MFFLKILLLIKIKKCSYVLTKTDFSESKTHYQHGSIVMGFDSNGFQKYYEYLANFGSTVYRSSFIRYTLSLYLLINNDIFFRYFVKQKGIEDDFYHFRTYSAKLPSVEPRNIYVESYENLAVMFEL